MGWLVFFAALTLSGNLGIVVQVNRLQFERHVSDEMHALTYAHWRIESMEHDGPGDRSPGPLPSVTRRGALRVG